MVLKVFPSFYVCLWLAVPPMYAILALYASHICVYIFSRNVCYSWTEDQWFFLLPTLIGTSTSGKDNKPSPSPCNLYTITRFCLQRERLKSPKNVRNYALWHRQKCLENWLFSTTARGPLRFEVGFRFFTYLQTFHDYKLVCAVEQFVGKI